MDKMRPQATPKATADAVTTRYHPGGFRNVQIPVPRIMAKQMRVKWGRLRLKKALRPIAIAARSKVIIAR